MTEPLCPYFGKCGGCSFQHIEYTAQLEGKKKALERATGFSDVKVNYGNEYHYRNRMDFIFHSFGVGLRKKGKWDSIVDIEKCVIANERINLLLKEVRDFFSKPDYYDSRKNSGTFVYAVIRASGNNSSVLFAISEESSRIKEAVDLVNEFANKTSADNVSVAYILPSSDISSSENFFTVKGDGMLKENLMGREFLYSVRGFFQNNTEMAEKMQEHCHNLLMKYDTKEHSLLDLYGGVGSFGIINSGIFREVFIVESAKESIRCAEENIKMNNIGNSRAVLLDAMQLKKIEFSSKLFVITDPPRSGMHPKTIEQLNKLKPKAIIYVSCNMEQLKKDIPKFKEYRVKSAALFDFFPQTPHSESVVEMVLE